MTRIPANRFPLLKLDSIRFLSLASLLIIPILLAACNSPAQSTQTINLVPADANLMAQVEASRILEDPEFQSLFLMFPKSPNDPQTFDEFLSKAQQETGIDFRRITTATLFSDVTRNDEYFGVIAGGPVNEQLLIAALSARGDVVVTSSDYNGVRIHTAESGSDTPVFAVLDSDTTVLGTLLAVQDVIDVKQGDLAAISGPVYQSFIDLGTDLGTPLISLAATVPPEALAGMGDSIGDGQGFGMVPAMESLKNVSVISFLIDRPGQDLRAEARLYFMNSDAATETGNTLEGLINLASAFSPDENVLYLLERLETIVDGDVVTVTFQAPISELQEAAQGMDLTSGGPH